ncbi:hypothetical protein JCGZ_00273 [Jatropha curcas]|uniref:Uncharacterized protein n=1 Tax=Jatropha curcas TaxID=180498 RepID=A0A067L1X3_JATCU|nr:hypothetical protein JCGZ_00273 [Jatropha curcas]
MENKEGEQKIRWKFDSPPPRGTIKKQLPSHLHEKIKEITAAMDFIIKFQDDNAQPSIAVPKVVKQHQGEDNDISDFESIEELTTTMPDFEMIDILDFGSSEELITPMNSFLGLEMAEKALQTQISSKGIPQRVEPEIPQFQEQEIGISPGLKKVIESIGFSNVGKIGIFGGARVGKTTFVKALEYLIAFKKMFECIVWVTVPKDWSLKNVQLQISRQLPSNDIIDDKHINSRSLFRMLEHIKFLLILDDVNEFIDLSIIGIPKPTPENGSKIVLTTRSEIICNIMAVDLKIRLQDLSSWELFCEDVGEVVYSPCLQPLANEVVDLCCDNADAIRIMAAALKDVSDVDIWRKALETLGLTMQPTSNQENLGILMVNVLKFSYERLQDDKTRKVLRNCAFLCKNGLIAVGLLIESCLMDGLIVSPDEGKKMLEDFININLLESLEDEEFVRMKKKVCVILLEHIIPLEEGRLFLGKGSMGLTKPPMVEEWEKSKEILLMDNQLSELPLSPFCPKLEALFLGRNYRLRMISPSFFDHMPALQVLNLSRTSIKSLPESLFTLINLRRLFLNHCDFIMNLSPKVGELKQLEVLDLSGTEIMCLPMEVGLLTKLTCLEVSFFEPSSQKRSDKIIPYEVIPSLSQLQELNFDVSSEDRRWNACAEAVVAEISKLQNLNMLKLYFPRVKLLSYLNCVDDVEMTSPLLSHFRFIVGQFVERVICRVPRDTEFELERYDKYLKYVNGEGIPEDIKRVLRHANAFFLDRHSTISKLSDFGYANMRKLKCCVAGQCNELQAIIDGNQIENESSSDAIVGFESLEYLHIYYMKNLRSICEGPVNNHSFCMLKYFTLRTCPELTTIFTPEFPVSFSNLEELTIHDCPKITSLVSCCSFEDKISCVILPALKRISLHFLPKLTSISNGLAISPELELMSFRYCLNLKRLPISKDFNKNLRKITGESGWWRGLEWESTPWDDVFVAID